jgi:PAS domain S-box-containing protein
MSDSRYERIFDTLSVGVAILDPETTRIAESNSAFAGAVGYEPADLEGRPLTALLEENSPEMVAAIGRAEEEPTQVELSLKQRSGAFQRVKLELQELGDAESKLLCTLHSVGDSTPVTASERRLDVALAGTDTGVWEWDMATDEVIWTESMERLFGLEPGTFEGTFEAFAKRVHPGDLSEVEAAIERAVESGEMAQTEFRIDRDDGEQRWLKARGKLQAQTEASSRLIGVMTDITDQKQSEQNLRKRERQYRQLVERLPVAHYAIDSEWRVTFCNQPLAERLDTAVDEIEGRLLWELHPEIKGTTVEETFRRVMETGEPDRCEYQYESGEHWVSMQVYPYEDGIAAVSTDISEQRKTLQSILDATPVIVYRFDADGVFQDFHGELLSRLDLKPETLVGESIFDIYADNDDVIEAAQRALDGESFRYTLTLGEITLETQYRPVITDGEVTSVIGVSMDVTELQRQREQMEFFNSILRHDVLNGMTVIKMRAELLAGELDGDHAQYAQTIVDWCNTTTEVTKRVRRVVETLATPEEDHQLEPINVSSILQRKVQELRNAYPKVAFETAISERVLVEADELLSDVLGNILTNSIEHNDTDGLRITTTAAVVDGTVEVRIADNGNGIDEDRRSSIFRRGETSHAKESGSGFGLFFVDVMVEKYGGHIHVEESESGGACFVLELPRADDA